MNRNLLKPINQKIPTPPSWVVGIKGLEFPKKIMRRPTFFSSGRREEAGLFSFSIHHILMLISKNALLGLGTELIRLAHQYRNGKHFHIDPISKEYVVQSLGVMLHPESCELIVGCGVFEPYTEYTKEDVCY